MNRFSKPYEMVKTFSHVYLHPSRGEKKKHNK